MTESVDVFSAVVKISIICLSAIGLFCNSGIIQKKFRKSMFVYFTNLSLLFCFLYFTAALVSEDSEFLCFINGFVVLAVTLTMAVFHFVLAPARRKKPEGFQLHFSDIVAHYAVPLVVIAEWLVFAEKGQFAFYYPLLWGVPFILYFFATVVYAKSGGYLEYAESRYPYRFMDPDASGVKRVLRNVIILFFIIIGLGYILLLIDAI